MKRLALAAAFLAALTAAPCLAAPDAKPQPKIQIAILLDTSSSMDGLINQTREQLWKIVNTFATAKRDGQKARLELALYEYGNDRLSAESKWIRQVSPFTSNLDKVSEDLFSLKTNGGEEYCGAVIAKATQQLEWSHNKGDLKLIYIAGNEPFSQGPVNYRDSVKAAIEQGIVVNTIHAGSESDGINGHWKDAAVLADGNFMTIDQNRAVVQIAAPQDAEIAKLGAKLNETYIGYGAEGGESVARQAAQDKNAASMSAGSATARAVSKSSAAYDNSEWDLVDAKKAGKKDVSKMTEAELPPPMKAMKPAERAAFVEEKSKERTELQQKIQTLNAEREKFVQAEMKKHADEGGKTLDGALLESARKQASKQAMTME
ncbi:MAG: vWA domain-containing protein [Myxococcaceae bacterium]